MAGEIGPFSGSAGPGGLAIVENAETIARLYRRLVLLVGFQILVSFLRVPLMTAPAGMVFPLALVFLVLVIGSAVALAVTAYRLAEQMGLGRPLMWALKMFLPCINIISLLVLSSKAQAWCKQYDIKVGLLGPTKESIEDLRRRVMTAPFD
jgi:predicted permease